MAGLGVAYRGPACPHCRVPLASAPPVSGYQLCPQCVRPFEAVRFTPPERRAEVPAVAAGAEGAAACPSHKRNVAEAVCGRCGVFLCGLCRLDVEAQVLCPACFDRLAAEGELVVAQNRFRDYEGVARLLVLLGLLTVVGGLVSGPAAIYYGVQARRQRLAWGDAPRDGRLALAVVLGLMNVAVSVGLIALIVGRS